METKQKYWRRKGKRGVLYLQERHCRVLLNDCLHTTDERIAERRRREIHIAVERGEYRAGKISFEKAVKESFDALVAGKAASTRGNYEAAFRIHLVPWFGKGIFIDNITYLAQVIAECNRRVLGRLLTIKNFFPGPLNFG